MFAGTLVFILLVFGAVFLMAQGLAVPTFGEGAQLRKRLKSRLQEIEDATEEEAFSSILREKYLRQLSPAERRLESLPWMESLSRIIDQAGHNYLAHRVILVSIAVAIVGAFGALVYFRSALASAGVSLVAGYLPFAKILYDRAQRIAKFEEQLPDAIDSIKRAVRAGHPFNSALKIVAEDMEDPIAGEFELTFGDINYGNDVRRAMLGMLTRMPSVAVMAFVTSVLLQKDTGGNLAEILERISEVIRSRFRFQRRVRTLSAEGRMSTWVLALIPLVLFVALTMTNPDYLPMLFDDPLGQKLLMFSGALATVGVLWIRNIIRIEV